MLLAHDGIFPIRKDKDGHLLPFLPASGLDIPGTIQGEGKWSGIPSLFVRLAGCNLHCCWQAINGELSPCDTTYAAYEPKDTRPITVEEIYSTIRYNTEHIRHIVLTGGEPLLQAKELKVLCHKLKQDNYRLTLETNATLYDEDVAQYIDLFSLSPKLSSSHSIRASTIPRLQPSKIQAFIDHARQNGKTFQLKFVYACDNDIPEIRHLLSLLEHWENEDILLMPLGGNTDLVRTNTHKTLECCVRYGWRYCDRLHLALFGDKAGV